MMQSAKGTVKYISSQLSATTQGGQLYSVESEVDNPGAILGGMNATANIQVGTATGVLYLQYL